MTTAADFLAAILANPEDDSPRLHFADWLEEHGQLERAEFIRVQCELVVREARRDSRGNGIGLRDRKWEPLHRREQELIKAQNEAMCAWLSGIPTSSAFISLHDWKFRRGFVEVITLLARNWLEHADTLTAALPIREVTLMTWPTVMAMNYDHSRYALPDRLHLISQKQFSAADAVPELLEMNWPRIKFTLPVRPSYQGIAP